MADLAKQLQQLNDAQRLRELAQQYGYGQISNQDINALRQAIPQAAGAMMPPPAQMPQYSMPSGQMQPVPMPQLGRQSGALPPVAMPSIPQGMTPADMNAMKQAMPMPGYQAAPPSFKDIFFNPGKVMQQNYVDPSIVEQMYYRGLLSR